MGKKSLLLFILVFSVGLFGSCQHHKNKADTVPQDSISNDIKSISDKIAAEPDNADLYWQRATINLEHKLADAALSDISKAIELKPGMAKYYITLSDIYLMKGMARNCREALEKAISLDNQDIEAYLKLAELSLYFTDYERVFLYTDQALKVDMNSSKAYFIRGYALKEKGDTATAIRAFQKAVEIDQSYYDSYIQLGLLYSAKKNKLAIDYFNSALNLKPQSVEALYNLGIYYQETEDFNKAMDKYRAILQIEPANKFAFFNLGYIHMYYLKIFDEAVKYFTKAVESDPAYTEAYYNRGYCHELMGDVINARKDYQKALSLKVNYQLALDGLNRLDNTEKRVKK